MPYYVHKYQISQEYGGPEEGGWYYESGVPVEGWQPIMFDKEDDAFEVCRMFNQNERERARKEEDYEFTSVLAHRSTHYAYDVSELLYPEAYPKVRPHYE